MRNLFEHQHVGRKRIDAAQQPVRLRARRHEGRGRLRIAARKQGHFMPLTHELVGQDGHDALGTSIEFWWNTFTQRCNLRNPHVPSGPKRIAKSPTSVCASDVPPLRQRGGGPFRSSTSRSLRRRIAVYRFFDE